MMKYRNFVPFALLTTVFAAVSCLEQSFVESNPLIEPDTEEVHAPCDLITNETVTSTLTIKSNRAWSATLPDGCDWVRLSSMQDNNLANITLDYPIKLEFDNNEGGERTADLLIKTNYEEKVVTIRQDAITPRLIVTSSKYIDNIDSEGGTFKVDVLSNVRWACAVDKGSTASISLDRVSGKYNSSINVTVGETIDQTNMSKGRVRFRAEGCEDQVVELIQQNADPYFLFPDFPDRKIYSIGEEFTFPIKTNTSWVVTIDEGIERIKTFSTSSGGKSFSSGSVSGTKENTSISILTTGNSDPDNYAEIKLTFKPNGGDPVPLTLTIDKLSHMNVVFNAPGKSFDSPFQSPTKGSFSTSGNSRKWAGEHYPLQCYNPDVVFYITTPSAENDGGVWRNSSQGFRAGGTCGTDIRDKNMVFFDLPVVPGKALAKVRIVNGYNARYDIRASDNSTVSGGEEKSTSVVGEALEWELSGTLKDTQYYLVSPTGGVALHEIELWYE